MARIKRVRVSTSLAEAIKSPVNLRKRRKLTPPPTPPSLPPARPSPFHDPIPIPSNLNVCSDAAVDHLSSHDPRFRMMYEHLACRPFQPPFTAINPFKTLVTSIIGQQVSWMAARAINNKFRKVFGFEDDDGFPGPAEVSGKEVPELKGAGLSTRKAEYVIELARHFLDGRLSTELLSNGTNEEISKALIAVRGIGQWTVDMFLMFCLRRPDVLPVGDLGVQKGLIRWVLAAHDALPASKKKRKGNPEFAADLDNVDQVDPHGDGEIDTLVQPTSTPPPVDRPGRPLTPITPNTSGRVNATLHTPGAPHAPPTPVTPAETIEVPSKQLLPPAPETFLAPVKADPAWDAHRIAPLSEGLTIESLKTRLSGKKVKGGVYLTPQEMESLTDGWRPYRSLGVYYMWPAGEEF